MRFNVSPYGGNLGFEVPLAGDAIPRFFTLTPDAPGNCPQVATLRERV
jgi:hypothetical protein